MLLAVDSNMVYAVDVETLYQQEKRRAEERGLDGVVLLNTGIGEFENRYKQCYPEKYPNVDQALLLRNMSFLQRECLLNATTQECIDAIKCVKKSGKVPLGVGAQNEINDLAQLDIIMLYVERLERGGVKAEPLLRSYDKGLQRKNITIK
jgi:hypothetical protein